MSQVVDIAIVILVALTVLSGLRRGMRRELINLAGVVVALLGGVFLARPVASLIARFGVLEEVPWLLAFIGGFLAASLLFSLLKAPLLPREIDLAERISGGVVGLGKGVVLAALMLYLLLGVWPDGARRLTAAPAARLVLPVVEVVDRVAGAVRVLLPRDFTERVRTTWEGVRRSGREVSEKLETIQQAGEQVREYGRTVGEGAAVVDSLLRPPPPRP